MGSFEASSFVWVASARQRPQLHTRWPGELVTVAAVSNTGEDLVTGLMHRREAMVVTSSFITSIEQICPESAQFFSNDELVISSYRPEAHEVEQTRIPELVFYGVQNGERSATKVSGGEGTWRRAVTTLPSVRATASAWLIG